MKFDDVMFGAVMLMLLHLDFNPIIPTTIFTSHIYLQKKSYKFVSYGYIQDHNLQRHRIYKKLHLEILHQYRNEITTVPF